MWLMVEIMAKPAMIPGTDCIRLDGLQDLFVLVGRKAR